ncbi:hypothetical protein Mapa_006630 [Marchantia paleacea]|nr:hypothetical protein Mapa_006630 [Marchantia paleacea]
MQRSLRSSSSTEKLPRFAATNLLAPSAIGSKSSLAVGNLDISEQVMGECTRKTQKIILTEHHSLSTQQRV